MGEIGGDPVEVSWNGDFVTLRFDLIEEASAYLTENARIPAGEKLVILRGLVSATGTAPIDKQMFDYLDVVDDRGLRVLDALDNFVELRDCPQPDAVPAGETKLVCAAYLAGVGTPIAGFALSIEADQPETWSNWRNT